MPEGRQSRIVTIDGPAGSGKSTLGRALAAALGLRLVDTGLFYRGVALAAHGAGLDGADDALLGDLAARLDIGVGTDPTAPEVLVVDGRDLTQQARDPRHATLLARVSSIPAVRRAVLEAQRRAAGEAAVAVGRDCGTVVFPQARVKIYLDAPADVRSRRRAAQLRAGGDAADDRTLGIEIGERDRHDSDRAVSPLRAAPDAHHIDSGRLGIDAMVAAALDLCLAAGVGPDPEAGRC